VDDADDADGAAALVILVVDPWVALSNTIRMVKSLIADPIKGGSNGYVAGFWNGKCGEASATATTDHCLH
jgi:hypothetical protein